MSTALTERDFYEVAKDIAPIQSFSFEEACDFVKYKKEQEVFKDKVNRFHKVLANSAGKTYEENAPDLTKHQFADGQYIRTITMPAKTFFISKVHLQNHPFFRRECRKNKSSSLWSNYNRNTARALYTRRMRFCNRALYG